jgi:hypothetical protein
MKALHFMIFTVCFVTLLTIFAACSSQAPPVSEEVPVPMPVFVDELVEPTVVEEVEGPVVEGTVEPKVMEKGEGYVENSNSVFTEITSDTPERGIQKGRGKVTRVREATGGKMVRIDLLRNAFAIGTFEYLTNISVLKNDYVKVWFDQDDHRVVQIEIE